MVTRDPNASSTADAETRESAQAAQEAGRDAVERGREQLYRLRDQAQERAKSAVVDQKSRAAEGLDGMADSFRQMVDQMRERDQQLLSSYVEKAADQIEQLSDYLRDRNVEDFIDDAQQMARRQPALFVGGAFALGFLMARFLKSSSPGGASPRSYSYESEWRSRRAERRRASESRRAGEVYAGGPTPFHETPYSAERDVPIREE